jgi:hypothetical protein
MSAGAPRIITMDDDPLELDDVPAELEDDTELL